MPALAAARAREVRAVDACRPLEKTSPSDEFRYLGLSSARQRARAEAEHAPARSRPSGNISRPRKRSIEPAPPRGAEARPDGQQLVRACSRPCATPSPRGPSRGRVADAELAQHRPRSSPRDARYSRARLRPPATPTACARRRPRCARAARAAGRGCARRSAARGSSSVRSSCDVVAVGEQLERLAERQRLRLHHEREDVAARAAAEAVVELLDRVDAERRRALVVERAQPDVAGRTPARLRSSVRCPTRSTKSTASRTCSRESSV